MAKNKDLGKGIRALISGIDAPSKQVNQAVQPAQKPHNLIRSLLIK